MKILIIIHNKINFGGPWPPHDLNQSDIMQVKIYNASQCKITITTNTWF